MSSPAPKRANSKKPLDRKALEEKFKELQKRTKEGDKELKDENKAKAKEIQNHNKILSTQKKGAEKDMNKRNKEVEKFAKVLAKVERETEAKSARQLTAIGKIDDTRDRLYREQKALEEALEQKVQEAAAAKGNLAHIEFAKALLEKNMTLPLDFVNAELEDEDFNFEIHHTKTPNELAISDADRDAERQQEVEELRSTVQKQESENTKLRQEIEEARRLLAEKRRLAAERDSVTA